MCNGSFESKAPRASQLTQPLLKGQKRRCRVVLCSWWQWFLGDYECRHNEDIAFVNLLHISNNSILLHSGLFRSIFWKAIKYDKIHWWVIKMLQRRGFGKSKNSCQTKDFFFQFLTFFFNMWKNCTIFRIL